MVQEHGPSLAPFAISILKQCVFLNSNSVCVYIATVRPQATRPDRETATPGSTPKFFLFFLTYGSGGSGINSGWLDPLGLVGVTFSRAPGSSANEIFFIFYWGAPRTFRYSKVEPFF